MAFTGSLDLKYLISSLNYNMCLANECFGYKYILTNKINIIRTWLEK